MSDKEMKKLDKKGEEEISGGASLKEILTNPEYVVDPKAYSILAYGGPKPRFFRPCGRIPVKPSQPKKPTEPLTPANPANPVNPAKPEDSEKLK